MGKLISAICVGVLATVWAAGSAGAGDFLIAASKPNKVFLIDAAARRVVRDCDIPGRGPPLTISPSPDGKIAYIVTNGWGEISGIDLDACREVFHANMSRGNIRGRIIGAMTVSRDGNWIFVMQSRVERLRDRFNVLPHRIAVYSTRGGFDPAPMRTFEVPRGIAILVPALDGKHLWAGGHDLYKIDMASGEIVETIPILYWQDARPTYGVPDGLAFWPIYDTTETIVIPYFAPIFEDRAARDAVNWDAMTDYVVGMTTVDLATNQTKQTDLASLERIIFSIALSPTDSRFAYGAYTTLDKYDLVNGGMVKSVDLDHTYYSIIASSDGKELYVGSTFSDIGVYSAETLEKLANIELPGGGDQGPATIRIVQR